MSVAPISPQVLTCGVFCRSALDDLLSRYNLRCVWVPDRQPIPGTYWGAPEAGLIADRLYLRPDTPLHSAMHEACHFVCMDAARRARLDSDAGGDCAEENGVCYLQVLLADWLPGFGRRRMLSDMDTWGYSFRLGSAYAWFERDADDARAWLLQRRLINADGELTWRRH